jgi:hypothetical protein
MHAPQGWELQCYRHIQLPRMLATCAKGEDETHTKLAGMLLSVAHLCYTPPRQFHLCCFILLTDRISLLRVKFQPLIVWHWCDLKSPIMRRWPLLWSSGQSSWLQILRSGFDSQRYQIFWEVVGLEWSPLSLVSTTEELLERKSSGSSLEIREYSHRDPSCWPCGTVYPQSLALTSPISGGRLVGIVS